MLLSSPFIFLFLPQFSYIILVQIGKSFCIQGKLGVEKYVPKETGGSCEQVGTGTTYFHLQATDEN